MIHVNTQDSLRHVALNHYDPAFAQRKQCLHWIVLIAVMCDTHVTQSLLCTTAAPVWYQQSTHPS